MAVYFSKTTLGFYETPFYRGDLPTDAVEIGEEKRAELEMRRQEANGSLALAADASGWPTLVLATLSEAEKKQRRIFEVRQRLSEIDTSKIRAITEALLSSDTSRLAALEVEASALRLELSALEVGG